MQVSGWCGWGSRTLRSRKENLAASGGHHQVVDEIIVGRRIPRSILTIGNVGLSMRGYDAFAPLKWIASGWRPITYALSRNQLPWRFCRQNPPA